MRRAALLGCLSALLLLPSAAAAAPKPLAGPDGVSSNKVLVLGVDGTRWDLVQRAMADGSAPNLAGLVKAGIGGSTLLAYQLPEAATLSEVGWSSVASGVWPAKHGVRGYALNNDPGQAFKNGYADFLTRIERARPALSTFMAADWANLGLHENGGPIFSDAADAKYAIAAEDSIASYDAGDQEVTDASARYLRNGNPDAGFVYLGVVDETAHILGSATQAYRDSIGTADKRIGRLLAAIRARPSYGRERWTIMVTTDHGQQNLSFGTVFSHGFNSYLERTSFMIATGPGVPAGANPRIVDVAPTVLHQLGVPVPRGLDGGSFVGDAPPAAPPAAAGVVRGGRLRVSARRGGSALRSLRVTLPKGIRLAGRRAASASSDNGKARRVTVTRGGRGLTVRLPAAGVSSVTLRSRRGALRVSRSAGRSLRRRALSLGVVAGAGERWAFSAPLGYRRR